MLDALYDTERGLSARADVRSEINELVSQLESMAPSVKSTEQVSQLLHLSLQAASLCQVKSTRPLESIG